MKLKIIPKVKKEREKLHKQKSNSSLSGESSGRVVDKLVDPNRSEQKGSFFFATVTLVLALGGLTQIFLFHSQFFWLLLVLIRTITIRPDIH